MNLARGFVFMLANVLFVMRECAAFVHPQPKQADMFDGSFAKLSRVCEGELHSSSIKYIFENPAFVELSRMDITIAPLLYLKAKNGKRDCFIGLVWNAVMHIDANPIENPWAGESIIESWEGGRERARGRTMFLLEEWRTTKKTDAAKAIVAQGVFPLETLFYELDEGRDDVLPLILAILKKCKCDAIDKDGAFAWWCKNKEKYSFPRSNMEWNQFADAEIWRTRQDKGLKIKKDLNIHNGNLLESRMDQ